MEILKTLSVLHSGSIFQNGRWGTRKLGKLKPTPQPVALGQAMKPSVGWFAMSALTLFAGLARAEGDLAAGKTVFANQCASCHTVEAGKNGFGPSLAAVFGRRAGTLLAMSRHAGLQCPSLRG